MPYYKEKNSSDKGRRVVFVFDYRKRDAEAEYVPASGFYAFARIQMFHSILGYNMSVCVQYEKRNVMEFC